jgi:predicted transcriptional regulator
MTKGKVRFIAIGISAIFVASIILALCIIAMNGYTPFKANEGSDAESNLEPSYDILTDLNSVIMQNGTWGDDVNSTAISTYANSINEEYNESGNMTQKAFNWTEDNFQNLSTEGAALFVLAEAPAPVDAGDSDGFDTDTDSNEGAGSYVPVYRSAIQINTAEDLFASQLPNGSWNDEISQTAITTYALASVYGSTNISANKGADWLMSVEATYGWGSVGDSAKAILALNAVKRDVDSEMQKLDAWQSPNGSFGDVENTSWALMALSVEIENHPEDVASALSWLKTQNITDDRELALSALAEQYYNSAILEPKTRTELLGSQGVFLLVEFIVFSTAILLVIFARLCSEDVMGGVRKDIFDFISANPGEHLAGITRRFGISSSSVRHHLLVLEWGDKIVSYKSGKLKHYYPNMNGYRIFTNGFEYKNIISTLKNDTTRAIVKFLMKNKGVNQKIIAETLSLHPSTVNWHAKRLKNAHLITSEKHGKDLAYSLNMDIDIAKVIAIIEHT